MNDVVAARRRLLENVNILVRRTGDLTETKLAEILVDMSDVFSDVCKEKVVISIAFSDKPN